MSACLVGGRKRRQGRGSPGSWSRCEQGFCDNLGMAELVAGEREGQGVGLHLLEEAAVPLCDTPAAMYLDKVGVIGQHFDHLAHLRPPAGTALLVVHVLQHHGVADHEGRERASPMEWMLLHPAVPLGHGEL